MLKIGCYGSIVALNPKSEKCSDCLLKDACYTEVKTKEDEALRLIERHETKRLGDSSLFKSQHHDIADVPDAAYHKIKRYFSRRDKMMLPPEEKNNRERAEYERMVKNGVKFPDIKSGVNPFSSVKTYEYMQIAVACLLDYKHIKQADIVEYYGEQNFGKSNGTRRTLAGRAIKVLTFAGVIKKEDGIYCLA